MFNLVYVGIGLFLQHGTVVKVALPVGEDYQPFKLYSELGEKEHSALMALLRPSAVEKVDASETISVIDKQAELCWAIGPIGDELTKGQLQNRFDAAGIDVEFKALRNKTGEDYWVYLGPYSSKKEALRKLRQLQANQVDSFHISTGDLKNGISLGVFKNRARADQLQRKYISLGYGVKLKVVERFGSVFWAVGAQNAALTIDKVYENLHSDFSYLENRKLVCKTLANAESFH